MLYGCVYEDHLNLSHCLQSGAESPEPGSSRGVGRPGEQDEGGARGVAGVRIPSLHRCKLLFICRCVMPTDSPGGYIAGAVAGPPNAHPLPSPSGPRGGSEAQGQRDHGQHHVDGHRPAQHRALPRGAAARPPQLLARPYPGRACYECESPRLPRRRYAVASNPSRSSLPWLYRHICAAQVWASRARCASWCRGSS